jgi:hypothetical protein
MVEGGEQAPQSDDELLWRRLSWGDVKDDGAISSARFYTRESDGVSVHRVHLTTRDWIERHFPGVGLAQLSIGQVRAVGSFDVVARPVRDEPGKPDDPSHALIIPLPTKGQARALARQCTVEKDPDDPSRDSI